MVMYRDFADRKAKALGIVGSVRNLPDGTVEVIAEGEQQALEAYLASLRQGPMLADVEKISAEWRTPSDSFASFSIQY